jgi:multidrug efflux pump subunit AcrA (membrane-fusion protein)
MSRRVLVFLVFITAVAFSVQCTGPKTQQGGKREQPAKLVKTEAVRQDSVRRAVEVVGTLAAEAEVTVSSQVEGIVDRVLADLGDRVRPARRSSSSIGRSCNTASTSRRRHTRAR